MKKQKLLPEFNWQKWSSTEQDLKKLEPHIVSRMLFDMFLINIFEHELLRLKNNDCVWGPVHSSVGQEALAAAAVAGITRDDKITGSHRAHHQFLAKALAYTLDPGWDPIKEDVSEAGRKVVIKTLAEIMGLGPGYCGGRGGSMHLRFEEAGILGTNAIVAGGIPLATGAAYAEKYRETGNIVVCFFGDGAANQGAFHEALNLAGLWELPIMYFIENNEYAVGTHLDQAAAISDLSLRASSYNMFARVVDGDDVIAVYETVKDAAEAVRKGKGPCIIEAKCYRHYHHAGDQPGSAYGYREKEEEAVWLEKDAVKIFPGTVIKTGIFDEKTIDTIRELARKTVEAAVDFCMTGEDKCRIKEELWPDPATAAFGMRSDGKELEGLTYSEKEDFTDFDQVRYSDAIAAVTERWMEKDENTVEFGEEVANFGGGAYGATKGLPQKYPDRIINTPISEAGFIGLTCGAAMSGMRPVVEIMFPDFALVAADQIFNQIGKARHMYGGTTDLPLVARTRIATGNGYGGQHSMDPIGLFALFPGWRIVAPSNAFDYVGLFNTAMTSYDPVVFLEHHSLYKMKSDLPRDGFDFYIPFGKARVAAEGEDLTVLTYGAITGRVLDLKEELENLGTSIEIIDLRSVDLPSIDYETIGNSVKKTGAVATVEEAAEDQSIGARIAAGVAERFFDELDAPPGCLTSLNVPNSVSKVLEAAAMISDEQITEGLEAMGKRRWK